MTPRCPNPLCQSLPPQCRKHGTFYRLSDAKSIRRWRCLRCRRHFSEATFQSAYRQNKRRVNPMVYRLLCSTVSMRRIALVLNLHRRTVARKLAFLAREAEERQARRLKERPKVERMQFDDLITLEHTKCKPLAVSLAVEDPSRFILGFEVSTIPASGPLAQVSRRKYGPRPNHRPAGLRRLFDKVKGCLKDPVHLASDEDPLYRAMVRRCFPRASHVRHKGGRGSGSGQGELKRLRFDPLFSLNHTCAMLRANVNRLLRRTWCTTKRKLWLERHLAVYVDFHNSVLLDA